ncbi:ABC transporter permease [Cumulibacter manganitolerans]|uniref:ABC transporter permease n=1 Tax=Cumulibacter manganitolerans TaxID=1884992 RepID=UPI001E342AB5|nr:ABC transporter permease [Cumulibacter manganitolerans]
MAKGLGTIVTVLLVASFATFALGAIAGTSPGAVALGSDATPEAIAAFDHNVGYDRPMVVRYLDWLGSALTGDLGTSWFSGISVTDSLADRLPVSLSLAGLALVLAVLIGAAGGILAGRYRGTAVDRGITIVAGALSTLPPFVAGIALIVVFSVGLGALPSGGYVPLSSGVGPWLGFLVLPAVALSLDAACEIARQLRTGIVAALDENYVTGAVVRGLTARRILFGHVLRNAAGPALAVVGLHIPRLIGGAVVTEAVFVLPGIGELARDSALQGDVPVVQGILLVVLALVMVSNTAVNIVLERLRPHSARSGS